MKKGRTLLAAAMLLLLSGCFSQSLDELYAPPKAPEDYLKLDNKINEVLNNGGEYAAPLTGELTQKVQLQDLNGDGVQEAIAFFRVSSDEWPLKICIYRAVDEDYTLAAVIEGKGSAINSVSYENLDDTPEKEIIVSWQMSAQVHSLAAYSIVNDQVLELFRTDYADYQICDIDGDEKKEIAVLQTGAGIGENRMQLYKYQNSVLELDSEAPLSRNVTGPGEGGIRVGCLQGGETAIFVTSAYSENGSITDIFAWKGECLENITLNEYTFESNNTVRWYTRVSGTDINGDGVMELPDPYGLPDPTSTSSAVNFWAIRWLQYDINGNSHLVYTTYYNDRDGWYFILPEEWEDKLTISRNDVAGGERQVIFSYWEGNDDTSPTPFLIIYTLSGDNRFIRANMTGRFRLPTANDDSGTIYAARFIQNDWDCGLDEAGVRENFSLIGSDWSYDG